ncbi:MAG: hypothetical protein IIC64_08205 [SAR324 cluster bacterium]|nr:hypothetical protein [SAR324 cluster bacterium]
MLYPDTNKLSLLSGIKTFGEVPDGLLFTIVDENGGASSICTRVPGGRCIAMVYYFTEDGELHGYADEAVSLTPSPDTRIQVLMMTDLRNCSIRPEYPANTNTLKPSILKTWFRRLFTPWTY